MCWREQTAAPLLAGAHSGAPKAGTRRGRVGAWRNAEQPSRGRTAASLLWGLWNCRGHLPKGGLKLFAQSCARAAGSCTPPAPLQRAERVSGSSLRSLVLEGLDLGAWGEPPGSPVGQPGMGTDPTDAQSSPAPSLCRAPGCWHRGGGSASTQGSAARTGLELEQSHGGFALEGTALPGGGFHPWDTAAAPSPASTGAALPDARGEELKAEPRPSPHPSLCPNPRLTLSPSLHRFSPGPFPALCCCSCSSPCWAGARGAASPKSCGSTAPSSSTRSRTW